MFLFASYNKNTFWPLIFMMKQSQLGGGATIQPSLRQLAALRANSGIL